MPRNRKLKQQTPLISLPLLGPGFSGLNTELSIAAGFKNSSWASQLENVVFDDLGRITLRRGYADVTTTAIAGTPEIVRLFEYIKADETVSILAVTDAFEIQESTDDGDTWSDISGGFTTDLLATTEVRFANLNDKVYAVAPGFKVYEYNGTGTFTQITSSFVSRGIILSAFGRLWVPEDATDVIRYSGLLDGTDWTTTSAGSIDASNVWTDGQDTISAIWAFGASLILFGRKHIIIYVDGAGSELGVDPDNLYVVDTIEGTGTDHPDGIVNIGEGDMWYIGDVGIQSLKRVIQEKVNPLANISENVKSLVKARIAGNVGSNGSIQAIYSPEESFVLINFKEEPEVLSFDTRIVIRDDTGGETWRAMTWDLNISSVLRRRNGDILFGLDNGQLGLYSTYRDNGVAYPLTYASPWLNFTDEGHSQLKIIKSFYAYIYGGGTITGTARWGVDYRPLEFAQTYSNVYVASGAEFNDGEWGSGEFGQGLRMRKQHFAGRGQGQVVKFFLTLQSDVDLKIALQEVSIRAKVGRRV